MPAMPTAQSFAVPAPTAEQKASEQKAEEEAQKIRDSLDPNKGAKDKHLKVLDENQHELTKHLGDLLKEYIEKSRNGEDVTEVKTKFEATIEYCIEKGKSFPENVLFFLMAATMKGLVEPAHLIHYDKYSSAFPPIGFLVQNANGIPNFSKFFSQSLKEGRMGKDFQNFYWSVIMCDPEVEKQTDKNAGKHLFDHDYIGGIAPAGTMRAIKQILTEENGKKAPGTEIENTYAGSVMWLETNKDLVFKDPRGLARGVSSFILMDGILCGAAYGKSKYARFDENMLKAVPRIAALTGHPKATVSELREKIWSAVIELDPILFRAMKDYDEKKWPIVQKRLKKYGIKNINSIDEVYERLEEILLKIIKPGFFSSRFGKFSQFSDRLAA